jgi:molybdate transport system substrate-binding protein
MQPGEGRRGRLDNARLVALGSVVVLVVLVVLLCWDALRVWFVPQPSPRPIVVYVAAVMEPTVVAVGKEYEAVYGVPIHIQSAGSQTLLAQIEVVKKGDLFIPADSDYLDLATARGLVAETVPAASMTAVLVVKEGNPKHLTRIADLLRDDVVLAQPDPNAAAVGKVTRTVLSRIGRWEQLQSRKKQVSTLTVTDAANAVQLGSADAAIVWDVTARQTPGIEAVMLPELADAHGAVGVGVLTCCQQAAAALRFARYLTARDQGLPQLARAGFAVVAGDTWAETPVLRLDASDDLRPVLEEAVNAFEQREGVQVVRVYDLPAPGALVVHSDPDHLLLVGRLRQALSRISKGPQQ